VGYDINDDYVKLAESRIKAFLCNIGTPKLFEFEGKKAKRKGIRAN